MKKCSKATNKFGTIEKIKLKFKDFILNKNGLFWISLILTILFVISPLILQIPQIKHIVSLFFRALAAETYKSSFMESIGSFLGTALTITGTLFIQKKIDKRTEKDNKAKEANDIRRRIIIIYYDLELAFKEIANIYNILIVSAFLTDGDKSKNFYDIASKYDLYIDDQWIRNVASLHDVFDQKMLEQIFLIYGDICSINNGLKANNHDEYQTARIVTLLSKYYNNIENGAPQLKSKYKDILEYLKVVGEIEKNIEK